MINYNTKYAPVLSVHFAPCYRKSGSVASTDEGQWETGFQV